MVIGRWAVGIPIGPNYWKVRSRPEPQDGGGDFEYGRAEVEPVHFALPLGGAGKRIVELEYLLKSGVGLLSLKIACIISLSVACRGFLGAR